MSLQSSLQTLQSHLGTLLYSQYTSQHGYETRLFTLETTIKSLTRQLTQSNEDCRRSLFALMGQVQDRLRGIEIRSEGKIRDIEAAVEQASRKNENLLNEIMRQAQDCKDEVAHIEVKVTRMQ